MTDETFLVTGANGCIGAWVLRTLVREGARVVATDVSDDLQRPRLLLSEAELAAVASERLDVTDASQVRAVVAGRQVTHIIHLAGLQIPSCRANPPLGAMVNVAGTVNVFEAARECWGQVRGLAYASSVAVLGSARCYPEGPVRDSALRLPDTLYGVYKIANEDTARLYWQDWRIPSVGLRPYVVFGVGRDQGMTSDITKALLAVAAGRPYHVKFGGPLALQFAEDVARTFIQGARSGHQGAAACNMRNDVMEVGDVVATIGSRHPAAAITWQADRPLPYPADLDDGGIRAILGSVPHTTFEAACEQTIAAFADLIAGGRIDLGQLDR